MLIKVPETQWQETDADTLQKGQFWNDAKTELTKLDRYKVTVHVLHIHIPSYTSNCIYYRTSY